MFQVTITPAAGKRLIAESIARHSAVKNALDSSTVVIVAGTTNGYVAEQLLKLCGISEEFSRRGFFRGITLPSYKKGIEREPFKGDVVIQRGTWLRGKSIFDVIDELREGDVILKGANAVDLQAKQAGVLIGDSGGGTIVTALQAVVGRRVRLILPVGLEKRVSKDLNSIAACLNVPGARGARMLPVPGEVITEIEAISILTGAHAQLIAGGGVCGAEGSVWLALSGSREQEEKTREILAEIENEPPFTLE